MDWKVVVWLVILYSSAVSAIDSSNQIVEDFFKNPLPCNNGRGTCLSRGQCNPVSNNADCGDYLVCCQKESSIVFPSQLTTTRRTTTPTTTSTTTSTTTTTTTTSTTTTTTTEEPLDTEYEHRDCGVGKSSSRSDTDTLEDTEPQEFPWNVGIFSEKENPFITGVKQNIFHCGGTLIDESVVLTAASCVHSKRKSSLLVIAGLWNLTDSHEKKRQVRKVSKIVKHPLFKPTSQIYDIAFIYMDDKFDYSPTVNRICLPDSSVDFENSICLVTGWGSKPKDARKFRPILKSARVQLMQARDCEQQLRKNIRSTFELDKSFQCTEYEEHIISAEDLGSPLVCTVPEREHQFYQVGIISLAFDESTLSLATNVVMLRSWIDERMTAVDKHPYIYQPQPIDEKEGGDTEE